MKGVPLATLLFLVGIFLVVTLPLLGSLHNLSAEENALNTHLVTVEKELAPTETASVSATPTFTPTPTTTGNSVKSFLRVSVTPAK